MLITLLFGIIVLHVILPVSSNVSTGIFVWLTIKLELLIWSNPEQPIEPSVFNVVTIAFDEGFMTSIIPCDIILPVDDKVAPLILPVELMKIFVIIWN